jgi:threonine aldolase
VGVIAAPGIVALEQMCDRLKEDHARAKTIAEAIAGMPGIGLNPDHVESNIIIFEFDHPKLTRQEFLDRLKKEGILASSPKYGIRVVTHNDIDDSDVDKLISAFKKILT